MAIVYSQDFSTLTVGSIPAGWSVVSGTWAIASGSGLGVAHVLQDTSGADADTIAANVLSPALANCEILFAYKANTLFGIFFRSDSNIQNGYLLNAADGTLATCFLYKKVSGAFTQIGSQANANGAIVSFAGNTYGIVMCRMRVVGQDVKVKYWSQGAAEPPAWSAEFTADGTFNAAGQIGFYHQGTNPDAILSVSVDNLTGSISISPTAVPAGSTGTAISVTGSGTSWTAGTPGSPTFAASDGTISSQSITSTTAATLHYNAPSTAETVTITDPSTGATASLSITTAAADFSLAPSSQSATVGSPTGNYTVTLNGALTSNETIALSDGGAGGTFKDATGSAIIALVFTPGNAGTPRTFTYTPASSGTKTLTATGSGPFSASHTATCVASTGPVAVAVNDSNVFFSPYNWRLVGSSYAAAVCPGAYVKMGFSGTSILLNLNISAYTAAFPGQIYYPILRWSIDGGAPTVHQIGTGDTQVTIASGLASGNHQLYLEIVSNDGSVDRWGNSSTDPASAVVIDGFVLDAGASTVAPALKSGRVIIFGDSITEGQRTLGNNSNPNVDAVNNDAGLSYAAMLGKALGVEYGQIGFGGLGYATPGSGNSPPGPVPFFTPGNDTLSSWNKISAEASRLVSGAFSPQPDKIFVMLGCNDRAQAGSTVQASVAGLLPALRAAAGANCWIFLIDETIGPNMSAYVLAAYNAYQAATPDGRCKILDPGTQSLFSFTSGPLYYAFDGIHPNYYFSGTIASIIADKAQALIDGSGGSAGYSRSRAVNA